MTLSNLKRQLILLLTLAFLQGKAGNSIVDGQIEEDSCDLSPQLNSDAEDRNLEDLDDHDSGEGITGIASMIKALHLCAPSEKVIKEALEASEKVRVNKKSGQQKNLLNFCRKK